MDIFSKTTTPTKIVTAMGEQIYEVIGRTVGSTTERHSVAHVVIPPGKFARRHYHPEAEESYHVTRGTAWVELDEEIRSLSAGESLLIPAGRPHKIANGAMKISNSFSSACRHGTTRTASGWRTTTLP